MPPSNGNPQVTDFSFSIGGTTASNELLFHTLSVTVEEELDLPSMFALHVVTSEEQENELDWINEQSFEIGNEVIVRLGAAGNLQTLMTGEIVSLEPEFYSDRLPGIIVRGFDRRHRLTRGRKTRSFVKQTDSAIASSIAQSAGLTAQVQDTGVQHDYVLQANQTDYEFLQERARRINYEVVIEEKKLIFRPSAFDQGEVLTLRVRDDLLEFHPRLSVAQQVSEVSVRGWNPKEKKAILGRAQAGDEVSKMGGNTSGAAVLSEAFDQADGALRVTPVQTVAEADQIAKALFNERSLALVSGEGLCAGRTELRPGKVIKIEGAGERFSGRYYIASTSHEYTPQQGYLTRFTVRRNAT